MVDMTQLSKCDSWPDAWHFNCYYGHGQGEVGVLDITPAIPGQGGLRSASHAGRHHPDDVNTWGPDGWLTKELRKRTQIMVVIGNVLYAHATVTQAYLVGRMLETAKKLVEEANASDGFFEHAEREARLLPWIGAQLPSDEDMSGTRDFIGRTICEDGETSILVLRVGIMGLEIIVVLLREWRGVVVPTQKFLNFLFP